MGHIHQTSPQSNRYEAVQNERKSINFKSKGIKMKNKAKFDKRLSQQQYSILSVLKEDTFSFM